MSFCTGNRSIGVVQRNVECEFCGLISYFSGLSVISWDRPCVFIDREVGTGLISGPLGHKWAINLLCTLKSVIMLKCDLQREMDEQKKICVMSSHVNHHRAGSE